MRGVKNEGKMSFNKYVKSDTDLRHGFYESLDMQM